MKFPNLFEAVAAKSKKGTVPSSSSSSSSSSSDWKTKFDDTKVEREKKFSVYDPAPAILRSVHTNPDIPPYPGHTAPSRNTTTNQEPKQEQAMTSPVKDSLDLRDSKDSRDFRDSRTPERCKSTVTSSSSSIPEIETKGVKLPSPSPPKTTAGAHFESKSFCRYL